MRAAGLFFRRAVFPRPRAALWRDPHDGGFRFRLKKLEDNGGDYNRAETVRAFLLSDEYRKRFGAQ